MNKKNKLGMATRTVQKPNQKEFKKFIEMVSKGKAISPVIVILPPLKGSRKLRIFKG